MLIYDNRSVHSVSTGNGHWHQPGSMSIVFAVRESASEDDPGHRECLGFSFLDTLFFFEM